MPPYWRSQKGFTLIELLLSIAIIGVLSSIVIVSLSGARLQARDAAVKGNARALQQAIEIYSLDNARGNGFYNHDLGVVNVNDTDSIPHNASQQPNYWVGTAGQACGGVSYTVWLDPSVMNASKALSYVAGSHNNAISGPFGNEVRVVCSSSPTSWVVAALMPSDIAYSWCIDSQGKNGRYVTSDLDFLLTACP